MRTGAAGAVRAAAVAVAAVVATTACDSHGYDPPDRAARVAEADSLYSSEAFDTISWSSESARIQAGNLVYADECRRCHGTLGRGDGDYARAEELDVPSLVDPEWEYGEDLEPVRRRIFTGHPEGMPTWGIAGLTPRQIDAAAFYIVRQLREEVTPATRLPGES